MSVIDNLKATLTELGYNQLALNDQIYAYLGDQGFLQQSLQDRIAAYGGFNRLISGELSSLDKPTNLLALEEDYETINLTWDWDGVEDDIEGFSIERQTNAAGPWSVIGTTIASVRTYSDTDLVPNTIYAYRVKAYSGTDFSGASNISVDATGVLQIPEDFTAGAIGVSSVYISWTDTSPYETGIVIERKQGSGSYSVLTTLPMNSVDYTDTTALPSTTYTYRAKAIYGDWESFYSIEDSTTTSGVNLTDWQEDGGAIPVPPTTFSFLGASLDGSLIVGAGLSSGQIYYSTNSGATWNASSAPPSGICQYVSVSEDGSVCYCTTSMDVWKSTDSGNNWISVFTTGSGISGGRVKTTPDGTKIFVNFGTSYTVSVDSGTNWSTEKNLGLTSTSSSWSNDGGYLYAFNTDNIKISTDYGVSFTTVDFTTLSLSTGGSVVCSGDGSIVYILSRASSTYVLFKSVDHGATFTQLTPTGTFDLSTQLSNVMLCSDDGQLLLFNSQSSGTFQVGLSDDGGSSINTCTASALNFRMNPNAIWLARDKGLAIVADYLSNPAPNKLTKSPL